MHTLISLIYFYKVWHAYFKIQGCISSIYIVFISQLKNFKKKIAAADNKNLFLLGKAVN